MKRLAHNYVEPEEVARYNLEQLLVAGLTFEGKSVLDLGCGTGTYTRFIAELGAAYVVGVDKETRNVDKAYAMNKSANVEFVCADIESWSSQNIFDLIFMRGTIYYLKSTPEEILPRFIEMLAPSGEVFITFLNNNRRAAWINALKRCASRTPIFLQVPVRNTVAAIYYYLTKLTDPRNSQWPVIRDKMNTLFFPANHLVDPGRAHSILADLGLDVAAIFGPQGQNPGLSDEYGVWAVRRQRGESRPEIQGGRHAVT